MTRSSLTEDTPMTPGWVDARIRSLFAPFGEGGITAGDTYATCLADVGGSVDVELRYDRCRSQAARAIAELGGDAEAFDRTLQALEAEIESST